MKRKPFDCVELKNTIQAKAAKEYENLTDEERWARIRHKLATLDHPVAQKWRALKREQHPERKTSA